MAMERLSQEAKDELLKAAHECKTAEQWYAWVNEQAVAIWDNAGDDTKTQLSPLMTDGLAEELTSLAGHHGSKATFVQDVNRYGELMWGKVRAARTHQEATDHSDQGPGLGRGVNAPPSLPEPSGGTPVVDSTTKVVVTGENQTVEQTDAVPSGEPGQSQAAELQEYRATPASPLSRGGFPTSNVIINPES